MHKSIWEALSKSPTYITSLKIEKTPSFISSGVHIVWPTFLMQWYGIGSQVGEMAVKSKGTYDKWMVIHNEVSQTHCQS